MLTEELQIRSDTGAFSLVPEWVLDAQISDRAVRLYAVLARYADSDGKCWPSRQALAQRCQCGRNSVDRARVELEAFGALVHQQRATPNGQTSNLYLIRRARPLPTGGEPPTQDSTPPLPTTGEPPSPPVGNGTRTTEREPTNDTARAQALTAAAWDAYKSKHGTAPLQGFVAARGVVKKAVTGGHTDEVIALALSRCDFPLTAFKLQRALEVAARRRTVPDPDRQSRKRGASE